MKTTMLGFLIMVLLTCFVTTAPVLAEPTGSSTIAGGNTPDPNKQPQDKRTDLTGGQQGVPDEYSTTPVRQGKLKEVTDSKWLNQPVTNPAGEKLGKITKVLKDEKTQNIEYVMFQTADGQTARPMPWSRFQESAGGPAELRYFQILVYNNAGRGEFFQQNLVYDPVEVHVFHF